MDLSEALTITFLGMSVVFSGLLATALLIVVLGRIHSLPKLARSSRPESADAATAAAPEEPPLDPELVSVIATVLEIERRLHRAETGRRLTFGNRR